MQLRSFLRVGAFALVVAALAAAPPSALAAKKKKKDGDPVADAFLARYKDDDAKVRSEAVLSLKDAEDADKLALLEKYVVPKEQRADVIARAVTVLSSIKDEQVVEAVVAKSRKGKTDARVVYLEALAGLPGDPPHIELLSALEDKEPRVRGMAAWGLGQHRRMDALEPLLALLDDRYWQVQSAAMASLYRMPDKDALRTVAAPKLIDFLEGSSGRMREDAAHALGRIMGRKLGHDVDKWRRLLAGEDVRARDQEGEEIVVSTGRYGDEVKRPHFYGLEVTSNRMVIVLDMSLSMNDPIEIDRDRLRRETSRRRAVTGEGSENEEEEDEDRRYDIPWWRIKSRLDMAREQTILLISELRDEQHFDVIFYSNEAEAWMGRLVPATSANRQKAIAALKAVKPDDKTNTWGALAMAFDMMGNQKKSYEEGPDEIYLVTDGAPSIGDIVDPDQILEAIVQLHRVKPIRINVIGIGVNLRFLRKMARETGGVGKFFTK